jgi:hypothetical protein
MVIMAAPSYSESDLEIMDTIRLHLYACYANVENDRVFAREELEEIFATDMPEFEEPRHTLASSRRQNKENQGDLFLFCHNT